MFCSNCGKPVDDGSKFCKNCGSKIDKVNDSITEISQGDNLATTESTEKFKITDDGIKSLIKKNLAEDENVSFYFYGIITASLGQMLLLGALSSLTNKNCIFNVTNKGVHIYGLTGLGKPKDYTFVPKDTIKAITIKNGLLGVRNILIEYIQGGKIKITANKHPYGVNEQEKNLIEIEKMYKS